MKADIKKYSFRKATLLDIPYIFNLIQDGSFSGSFTQFLMTSKGYYYILRELFPDVLKLSQIFKTEKTSLFIFTLNNDEIGFLKIKTELGMGNVQIIELCSINPELRNQRHGSQMIHMYIESLPEGTEIIAYCTKYSRAMQHVLVKQKFKRDRKSFPLECYRYTKKSVDLELKFANLQSDKSLSNGRATMRG
jgi:hypothetical protein